MVERPTTAYVLAGGQSRRMGSDKLLLPVDGHTLLSRTVSVCREVFDTVKIAAREPGRFSRAGCQVVIDRPRVKGPMAGVLAALADCTSKCCFVTAADLVDLSSDCIRNLVSAYKGEQYLGLQEAGGIQPLCGIYDFSAVKTLEDLATQGNSRMTDAVKQLEHRLLPLAPSRWRNINRPQDWHSVKESHG
jgi:molybdopterin-guanine dinucleotide biosynthesis protein A